MKKYIVKILFTFACPLLIHAGVVPTYRTTAQGGLSYLYFANADSDTVYFHAGDSLAGPALFLNGEALSLSKNGGKYTGSTGSLDYGMSYAVEGDQFVIKLTCHNRSEQAMNDLQFSLQLGINTEMRSYPAWRSIYFPTLLRCERSHFWGYLMNPDGGIVTLASPDPIASYRLNYNNYAFDWPREFGSGHLIQTVTLDLLNPQPLPDHNPKQSDLKNGENRSWTIYLGTVKDLADVIPATATLAKASTLTADVYTVDPGESIRLTAYGRNKPLLTVETPDGKGQEISITTSRNGIHTALFTPKIQGLYRLLCSAGGKTSEARLSVRHPWSNYMQSARRTALKYRQKASSHVESWLGFFPAFIAAEYFPDKEIDAKVDAMFNEVFPLMYDPVTHLPPIWKHRIQNHALAAALYAQRYRATKDINDLHAAANLADFMMTAQGSDGAYRSGRTHYTSVSYCAKAIMEVMAEEKVLADKGASEWADRYRNHYASVKKAIDELAKSRDDIETEGELTFEDGMIACSYTQLAAFALLQPRGSSEWKKYIDAAEYLYQSHRCLSQHLIPDSRVHGASIRFWESQYDILTPPDFVNSPHGWSAWRIYGVKYLYEATGKECYLTDMISALGACAQLLNPQTDHLNWAFVCDPYVKVHYFVKDPTHKALGERVDSIVGGQYLNMISDWYQAPPNKWVSGYWGYDGGCCDNDVNEIFKCMGEIALTSAYFHLRSDGTFRAWNCKAVKSGDKWLVTPSEACVQKIYVNTDNVVTDKQVDVFQVIRIQSNEGL